jgi:hypothetical protein
MKILFKEKNYNNRNILFSNYSTFTCQCKAPIYSFQKILDFPLLLPINIKTINIISLLSMHFKPEEIDFERICDIKISICINISVVVII